MYAKSLKLMSSLSGRMGKTRDSSRILEILRNISWKDGHNKGQNGKEPNRRGRY